MKKSFFTAVGLMLFALAFSSCQKEPAENAPAASEPNFTLFAQPSSATKTTNEGLDTKWADGDAINVFHAAAGTTTYVSDGQFSLKDTESGRFDGTVSSLTADASYDWYAFYPYSSYLKTSPKNTSESYCYIGSRSDQSQSQTGNDNMSHICGVNYPLFGIVRNIKSSDTPSITMQHLTSVIKIVVTNSTDEELSLSSVSFTAEEDIAGQFYIAFDSETPTYTPTKNASETANLTISGVNVAAGSKGIVYMAIKPFTAKSGSSLKLSVNSYEKTITLPSDITFTAGHIKTLGFDFDKKVLDCVTLPWSIDGTGGSSIWKNTIGLSQNGLGSDYANGNKPYLTKFDTDKDYVQIKYDSPAAKVKFGVKMFGTSASTMTVQGSADGTAFSDIEAFTIPKTQNGTYSFTTSKSIEASFRYIRLSFTKGGNIGLGAVEITKESTDPIISADNIVGVSAHGLENQTLAYSINNGVDGAVLTAVGDGTVVTAKCENNAVTYTVAANTTTSDREGTITLTYAKDGVTLAEKTVKVQQLAPVFKVSRTSVELDATKGAQTKITVTSDFDWMADASASAGFAFTPDTYTWQEGGKETVTITASADNASESGTATLGTITFSNLETEEEIIVTVTQKSSYVAPTTGKTVTITFNGGQGQNDGLSWESSPIKIVANKGDGSNAPYEHVKDEQLRFYGKNTLTISGATITKVEFAGTVQKFSANEGTVASDNKSWTGTSTNLIITNTTGSQAKLNSITITYEE